MFSFFNTKKRKRKWQPTLEFLAGKSHGQDPGRLQSIGSQKVGDLATEQQSRRKEINIFQWFVKQEIHNRQT